MSVTSYINGSIYGAYRTDLIAIIMQGREATFSALAAAPLFAAKIPVGMLSGYLISKYLPDDSSKQQDGQTLWLIIGILTM